MLPELTLAETTAVSASAAPQDSACGAITVCELVGCAQPVHVKGKGRLWRWPGLSLTVEVNELSTRQRQRQHGRGWCNLDNCMALWCEFQNRSGQGLGLKATMPRVAVELR